MYLFHAVSLQPELQEKKKVVEQIKEKLKIDKCTLERQLQKYQCNFKASILEGRMKTTSVLWSWSTLSFFVNVYVDNYSDYFLELYWLFCYKIIHYTVLYHESENQCTIIYHYSGRYEWTK